jgi:single-strand DNA-binding protein
MYQSKRRFTMLNKVQLIGRLGKEVEMRSMTNGEAVANVSIATTESWKDKAGDKQEKTEWHNLVFYRGLAEIAGEYLTKGSLIYIEGKLTTEKYEKNGEDRYATKIVVSELKMLGGNNQKSNDDVPAAKPDAKPDRGGKAAKPFDNREPF